MNVFRIFALLALCLPFAWSQWRQCDGMSCGDGCDSYYKLCIETYGCAWDEGHSYSESICESSDGKKSQDSSFCCLEETTTDEPTTTKEPGCCYGNPDGAYRRGVSPALFQRWMEKCTAFSTERDCLLLTNDDAQNRCHWEATDDEFDCSQLWPTTTTTSTTSTTSTTEEPTDTTTAETTTAHPSTTEAHSARAVDEVQQPGFDTFESDEEATDSDSNLLSVLAASIAFVAVVCISVALLYALRRKRSGEEAKVADEMIVDEDVPDHTDVSVEMITQTPITM